MARAPRDWLRAEAPRAPCPRGEQTWARSAHGSENSGSSGMLKLRTEALRWGVGAYCATLGASMLVAPHQFGTHSFVALQPHLAGCGALFLLAGVCLLAVA